MGRRKYMLGMVQLKREREMWVKFGSLEDRGGMIMHMYIHVVVVI